MLTVVAFTLFTGFVAAAPVTLNPANLVYIQSERDSTCLSAVGGTKQEPFGGLQVISWECKDSTPWIIDPVSGSILLARNSSFALDAGEHPANMGQLKIWQSFPGLPQQDWSFTGGKFSLSNGKQCLDQGDNGVQLYQCTEGNTNQVWKTLSFNTTDLPDIYPTFIESWSIPNEYASTVADSPQTVPIVTYTGCGGPPSQETGVIYEGICSTVPDLATLTKDEVKQTGK